MLSSTRSSSNHGGIGMQCRQSAQAQCDVSKETQSNVPPEIVSSVFSCMPLKELVAFRGVSSEWRDLVDLEARLRFLKLTGDASCPFVLQAGPPALFDVCEFLGLDFRGYSKPAQGHAPLIGTLCVSHQDDNPYHKTTMSDEDAHLFENIILSITRVEKKLPQTSSMNRQLAFRNWTNWEVARESDRVWRNWWDNAPTCTPLRNSASSAHHDSGFAESSFLEHANGEAGIEGRSLDLNKAPTACLQPLDIGKTIHRAILDVSITEEDAPQHQYQWDSVELDVFRVLLAFEERASRAGLRAMVSAATMYVY